MEARTAESQDVLERLSRQEELLWCNPKREAVPQSQGPTMDDIRDAEAMLYRYRSLILKCYPETYRTGGLIESRLRPVPKLQQAYADHFGVEIPGRLLLKQDSHLPIAGSVKARGGVYEVLKHAEDLAFAAGLLTIEGDYATLAEHRDFFADYKIQVGSTGNLGISIGIMAATMGFQAIVHMSADARQWKKDLLRSHGVTVIEYKDDYSAAVAAGRAASEKDPKSYFVDDERSVDLLSGYAVAGVWIERQLHDQGYPVDPNFPLFVYIPCGVGGAPGGIAYGLSKMFRNQDVHVFFAETTPCPDMLLGMASGKFDQISVKDIGLSGQTAADGLACPRCSALTGRLMEPIVSGIFTVKDGALFDGMRLLEQTENIFIEPSSCAALAGPQRLLQTEAGREYLERWNLTNKLKDATHVIWATGGALVPENVREEYRNTFLED